MSFTTLKQALASLALGLGDGGIITAGLAYAAEKASAAQVLRDPSTGITMTAYHLPDYSGYYINTRTYTGGMYQTSNSETPSRTTRTFRFALRDKAALSQDRQPQGCAGRAYLQSTFKKTVEHTVVRMAFDGTMPGHKKCALAGKTETYLFQTKW